MINKKSIFQKRHYKFIAQILGDDVFTMHEVNLFVAAFKKDNPKFNEELFVKTVVAHQLGINDASQKHKS